MRGDARPRQLGVLYPGGRDPRRARSAAACLRAGRSVGAATALRRATDKLPARSNPPRAPRSVNTSASPRIAVQRQQQASFDCRWACGKAQSRHRHTRAGRSRESAHNSGRSTHPRARSRASGAAQGRDQHAIAELLDASPPALGPGCDASSVEAPAAPRRPSAHRRTFRGWVISSFGATLVRMDPGSGRSVGGPGRRSRRKSVQNRADFVHGDDVPRRLKRVRRSASVGGIGS
jgi:hypothetical protein